MSSRIKDTSWPISLSIFTFFLSDKPERLCLLLSKSNPPKPSHILWNDGNLALLPLLDTQLLKWIICVGFETLWLFFVIVVLRSIKMNYVSGKPHLCRVPSVISFGVVLVNGALASLRQAEDWFVLVNGTLASLRQAED